jgi:MscS family membrane protein
MPSQPCRGRWWLYLAFAAALFVPSSPAAWAQPTVADIIADNKNAEDKKAEAEEEEPFDEFGRTNPRATAEGFLKAANQRDYARAAEYLDLGRLGKKVSKEDGADMARMVKAVLDRTLWVDVDAITKNPKGRKNDGLPTYRESIGRVEAGGEKVDVLLQKTKNEQGVDIWKFSSATVAQLVALHDTFGYGILEEYLPEVFFQYNIGPAPLIEWLGLLVLAVLSFVFATVITAVLTWILHRRKTDGVQLLSRFVSGPARLFLAVAIFSMGASALKLTVFARAALGGMENALLVIAAAWTILRLADVFGSTLAQRLVTQGQGNVVYLIPPARKVAKGLIIAFAVIAMLGSFGFDITALLAGLGVGGIAIALGAQKTLENLFGGLTLFTNQPVRVGDFCRFGDKTGTVEEIGLYSTRVRTIERTLITVPNSEFSSLQLENFGLRDRILYKPTIGLRYETTPEQLRYVLIEVRKMLYAHPKVDPDPARVRFKSFGAYSLDIEVFAYVKATDVNEFLEVAEDLNLRIMDLVAAAGTSFAFPSQTMYVEQGEGIDREAARAAEQAVQAWRERRELFLPRFPPERIAEMRGKLDYPPEGSPHAPPRRDGAGKG